MNNADAAREWVSVNYPLAEGDEWDRLVEEAKLEIDAINDANDANEI